jgi:hypothetical protein
VTPNVANASTAGDHETKDYHHRRGPLGLAVTPCRADEEPKQFSAGAFTAVCVVKGIERGLQPHDAAKECGDFLKEIQDEEIFWRRNHRY